MTTLAGLLRVATVVAWFGTIVEAARAFSGGPTEPAIFTLMAAALLTLLGGAVRRSATLREKRKLVAVLMEAGLQSPRLMELVEHLQSAEYQRSHQPPDEHPYPSDSAGAILTALSWLCLLAGTALIAVVLFVYGTNGMLILGVLMILSVTPLHHAQQTRFADHVLSVYEREMLVPMDFAPSRAQRLAFWSFAQNVARHGKNSEEHAGHIIEVYVDMVGAWADDIEDRGGMQRGGR